MGRVIHSGRRRRGRGHTQVEANWGWAMVDGRRYDGDIVIHVDGSVTPRQTHLSSPYRQEMFHTPLSEQELGFLGEEAPVSVIVGAGFRGMMNLTAKVREMLAAYDAKVVVTPDAPDLIHRERRRWVAILHLTC